MVGRQAGNVSSINEATLAYCKQIPHYYFSFGIVITVGIYLVGNYHLV